MPSPALHGDILKHVCSRQDTHRFGELRRKIGGVSEKRLAQSLQSLADDGFVRRGSHSVVPPSVDYRLTPLGEEVAVHVATVADWIKCNLPRVLEQRKPSREAGEAPASPPHRPRPRPAP